MTSCKKSTQYILSMMLFRALKHLFESPIMCFMLHIKTSIRLEPGKKIGQGFSRSENVLFFCLMCFAKINMAPFDVMICLTCQVEKFCQNIFRVDTDNPTPNLVIFYKLEVITFHLFL